MLYFRFIGAISHSSFKQEWLVNHKDLTF